MYTIISKLNTDLAITKVIKGKEEVVKLTFSGDSCETESLNSDILRLEQNKMVFIDSNPQITVDEIQSAETDTTEQSTTEATTEESSETSGKKTKK